MLDYERASEVIADRRAHRASASATAGTRCSTSGRACDAPHGHLHDLQRARPTRSSATASRGGWTPPRAWTCCSRPASATSCSSARTSREQRQLHLQLLRLLLRGDDRRAPVRLPAPGPHHQLPPGGRRATRATAAASASTPARSRRWRSSRPTIPQAAAAEGGAARRGRLPGLRRLRPRLPERRRCALRAARRAGDHAARLDAPVGAAWRSSAASSRT